jgi:hypothetical protein
MSAVPASLETGSRRVTWAQELKDSLGTILRSHLEKKKEEEENNKLHWVNVTGETQGGLKFVIPAGRVV